MTSTGCGLVAAGPWLVSCQPAVEVTKLEDDQLGCDGHGITRD